MSAFATTSSQKLGKRTRVAGLFIALLPLTASSCSTKESVPRPSQARLPDFQQVSAKLRPSVVSVITTGEQNGQARWGMASGVVVGPQKQILTNAHVLQGAQRIYVQHEDRPIAAEVMALEPRTDLALLRLKDPSQTQRSELKPIQWSNSTPAAGQWAICMGHPYGLGHTVTVGVVSGRGRDYDDMGRPDGLNANGWWSMLQIDAAINVGNSGGPVVNQQGEVMGIATAIRSDGQGLAFAVPATMAQHFIREVRQHGNLRVARLGATVEENGAQDIPGRLQSLKVISVAPEGPAHRAGLRVGDLVLRAGQRELHRLSALSFEVQRHGVGASISLQVQQNGPNGPIIRDLKVRLGPS